jgi:hypothetical protein
MKFTLEVFVLWIVLVFASATQTQSYVFVAEQTNQTIEGFTVNPITGALVAVPGSPFADADGDPIALAANPLGTFLFAADYNTNTVSIFSIASTGTLEEISPFTVLGATEPTAIAVSTDGHFLFVASGISNANPISGLLNAYSIDTNGLVSSVSSVPAPSLPVGIFVSSGFIYVAGSGVVQPYSASQGIPTPLASVSLPTSDVNAIAGTASFLFVARGEYIDTLAIASDGSLTLTSTYDAGVLNSETNLAVSGVFLFSNQNTYAIGTDGTLTPTNLNWVNSSAIPLAASTTEPFIFVGSQSQTTPPLIYPLVVAANSETTNSEPPIVLAGVPTAILVATGTTPAPTNPAFVFEPSTFQFQPVTVGQDSTGQIEIISTGNTPLTISGISISGDPSFTETNDCPANLAPKATCDISLTFAPSAAGNFSGSLNLAGNVSGTVPLNGSGIAPIPTLTFAPAILNFSATVGQTASQTVTVNNTGAVPFIIESVETSGGPFTYQSGNCRQTQQPGSTCSITVGFVPTAAKTTTGSLNFYSVGNLQGNGPATATVPLVGIATAAPAPPPANPTISIAPQSQQGSAGQTFTYNLTTSGFSTTPNLSASCQIQKASCVVSGGKLVVTTSAPAASMVNRWIVLLGINGLALICMPPRKRKTAFCVAALLACAACGGTSGTQSKPVGPVTNGGTPNGSYTISVAANGVAATAELTIQ